MIHGLYSVTSVSQVKVEEKHKEPQPERSESSPPETPQRKIECTLPNVLDFDTSGSMGSIPPEALAHAATDALVRKFQDTYMSVSDPSFAKYLCGITLQDLYRQRGIAGINDAIKSPFTIALSKDHESKTQKIDLPFTAFLNEEVLESNSAFSTSTLLFDATIKFIMDGGTSVLREIASDETMPQAVRRKAEVILKEIRKSIEEGHPSLSPDTLEALKKATDITTPKQIIL